MAAVSSSDEKIALLRPPTMDDPWSWLGAGWADIRHAPLLSIGYGVVFVLIGLAGTAGLWLAGLELIIPVAAAGFALVGPVLALGLYEISRRLERDAPVDLAAVVRVRPAEPLQLMYLSFALGFVFLVWIRIAMLLYAGFAHFSYMPLDAFARFALETPDGLALLITGTVIGGLLALFVFAISALAVPMLLDRHVDAMTAMGISMRTVLAYPGPMLLWAWLIAVMIAFGFATLFIGLVVAFPLIGYATWHAYRSLIAPA